MQVSVVITCSSPIVKRPIVKSPLKRSGNGTPFCRGETRARNRFWMITREREAREQERHEARAAQRPEREPLHQHRRDRRRDDRRRHLHHERHVPLVAR